MGCMSSSHANAAQGRPAHVNTAAAGRATQRAFSDRYETYGELQAALRQAGLEASQLVIAIDYTRSNEWTGQTTFGGRPLHYIDANTLNPYQHAINVITQTLEPFDDDHIIPVFGFGDVVTTDKTVFPFYPNRYCHGLNEVLDRYNEITPSVVLSGPTNFAPAIYEAINIVKATGRYHILLIIADGQVTNGKQTQQAIIEASRHPISIVLVGVGDGPWGEMEHYDDYLQGRMFDNFQFVNYHSVVTSSARPDIAFATAALMEVPRQYLAIKKLNLL